MVVSVRELASLVSFRSLSPGVLQWSHAAFIGAQVH